MPEIILVEVVVPPIAHEIAAGRLTSGEQCARAREMGRQAIEFLANIDPVAVERDLLQDVGRSQLPGLPGEYFVDPRQQAVAIPHAQIGRALGDRRQRRSQLGEVGLDRRGQRDALGLT